MPAPPLSNDFDGGTAGATISTGNSGGASGDAWTDITIGGSAALIYDGAHPHSVPLAMKPTQPASSAQACAGWSGLGSLTADVFFRTILYLTAYPPASNTRFFRCFSFALADCCHLAFGSPGGPNSGLVMAMLPAGTTIAAATGAVQIALNQLVRVEWRIKASTTAGEIEWRLYNSADAAIASFDDTKTVLNQVLAANLDRADFGAVGPDQSSYSFWMDDISVSTVGWIGPAASGVEIGRYDLSKFPKQILARS